MARRGDGLPKVAPVKAREAHPGKLVAFHLGISAESRAAAFLIAKGFRILARRWKSPLGPFRIDYGFKTHRRDVAPGVIESRGQWWFSFGQAF